MIASRKYFQMIFCALCFSAGYLAQNGSAQPLGSTPAFEAFLFERFRGSNPDWTPELLCPATTNPVAARVFREYGAIFVASDTVQIPSACLYPGESSVLQFQKGLKTKMFETGGVSVILQESAADALQRAISDAGEVRLSITPLDGAIAGSRSYGDTLRLWNGRFFRALDHWTRVGKLTPADRAAVSAVSLEKRIEMIMAWEAQGIYFSTDRRRSIFTSTAPPGASQHLSMLAFDVVEYGRPQIGEIMNRNGWFQTVIDDPPHFTFLGVAESELPRRGLRLVRKGRHRYWVPDLSLAIR